MERRPDILYLLLLCLSAGGALRVTVWPSLVSGLRGRDVSIVCDVSELNVNRQIDLHWSRKVRGVSTDVYTYLNGEVKLSTPRYHVTTEEILRGNATLHISELQVEDEGEYTCDIINTPNHDSGSSTLQVSAPPSVTVTPEDPRIELGTEISTMCELTGFYPQAVTILWVRHHKHSPGYDILRKGKSTTDPEINSDGTFNITSQLILRPQKEDDGSRYSCNVTHRSLEEAIVRSFTLTVTEDKTWTIAGWVIGTLLVIVLITEIYITILKPYPPTVSEITGNDQLTDMSPATLSCHIMDYRPKDITISVRLRRSREQEETTIYTWRSRDPPTRGDNEGAEYINIEEHKRMGNGGHLRLEMVPVIRKRRFGRSSQCSLHITPSYDTDHGAELSLHVTHPAMTSPFCVRRTLKVTGVAPQILGIVTPRRIQDGEKVTLTCPISGFKPKALSITWLRKKEEDVQGSELLTWKTGEPHTPSGRYSHTVKEKEHDDHYYTFMSALTLKATIKEDNGVTYICRTFHPSTEKEAEESVMMEVTAVPVMDPIEAYWVSFGGDLSLSCRIHSFYPSKINVRWYTEKGKEKTEITSTSDEIGEEEKLCHVTSRVIHKGPETTFRCEVRHDTLTAPISSTWTWSEDNRPRRMSDSGI